MKLLIRLTIFRPRNALPHANRKRLSEALVTTEIELTRLRRMVHPFALTMSAIAFLVIALSFPTSWFWASAMIDHARQVSLRQMGLEVNETQIGQVLTWDENRLRLITCQSGKTKTPCLQIIQGD